MKVFFIYLLYHSRNRKPLRFESLLIEDLSSFQEVFEPCSSYQSNLHPHAPVMQEIADDVVFWRFKGEKASFFLNRTSLTPSDFWCASFGKYQFKPFQLSFFSGFYIKIMFWVRWFYSLFERMRLKRKKWCLFTLTNL